MFYIQNKPFKLNNNIYIESSCSQSLISTEELQSLHLDCRRKLFHTQEDFVLTVSSNRAVFLFNITVVTQNILIWTGLDLEHHNVILNVKLDKLNAPLCRLEWMWRPMQHATDSLTSVNDWPINYGSWWGCQLDRWLHLSNRHMAVLLCGLFRDYDQVKRFHKGRELPSRLTSADGTV